LPDKVDFAVDVFLEKSFVKENQRVPLRTCRFVADLNFRFAVLVILPLGAIGKFDAEVMCTVLKFGKMYRSSKRTIVDILAKRKPHADSVPRLQSRGYGFGTLR
jgi:hypothetical protein